MGKEKAQRTSIVVDNGVPSRPGVDQRLRMRMPAVNAPAPR